MFQEFQLLLYAIAYLIGSIPFGLLLTRAAGMGDIRALGSGNIGATNVLRAGGKKVALLTLLLDAGKGYAAVYLSHLYMHSQAFIDMTATLFAVVGLCVILGHCFPVWLKFRGGKGVATAFGVVFALSLNLGLACAATWLLVFLITRYSSLAALLTMTLMPFYAALLVAGPDSDEGHINVLFILKAIAILILYRHRSNINKLFAGKEHKFGSKEE